MNQISINQSSFLSVALLVMLSFGINNSSFGDDDELKSKVEAPKGTVEVSGTLGGSFYVDKNLVEQSDALKNQLKTVKKRIRSGELNSKQALKKLEAIEVLLENVTEEIELQKILVAAFNVYRKTEKVELPLGTEKQVIITGDKIRIRTWEGPGIRCELEKIIVAKKQPADKDFDEIRVVHEHGSAENMIGKTAAENEKEEADFLASEDGKKMSPEQLEKRRKFMDEQFYKPREKYAPMQGKECDQITLKGLVWKEGNKQLSLEIQSESGGSHSSQWQRHAKLTIFVPKCNWVLVRGCQVGVDIEGIESNLMLTTQGSTDKDYDGKFTIKDITGDVVIDQAPIRELTNVKGNVTFNATAEMANGGTHHEGGFRTTFAADTANTTIRKVSGNLTAHFVRTNLQLANISGVIDIQNEFGDTSAALTDNFDRNSVHRILTESGTIEINALKKVLAQIPVYAHTMTGAIHSNVDRKVLDTVRFSTGNPRRNWTGFVPPSNDLLSSMAKFERPKRALEDRERKPGLDLISRGGTVNIIEK